jgi:hypothetical protein
MTLRAVTIEADDELVTLVGGLPHGFRAGEEVEFIRLTGGTGLSGRPIASINAATRSSKPTRYFVIASGLTRNAFKVSATAGGSAVDVSADATGGWVRRMVRAPGDA